MSNPALEKVLKEAGLTDAAVLAKAVAGLTPVLKEQSDAAAKEAARIAKAEWDAEAEKKKKDEAGDGPVMKEDGNYDYSRVPANQVNIWKEKHATDAKLAKVQKQLDDEREVRVSKEFTDKAAGYKHLGVKTEDLGRVMKSLHEKDPESFKVFEPILKSLDEKVSRSGLYRETGTSASGASSAATGDQTAAEARAADIAKSYVEKDGKLTKEAAIAKAFSDNPHLYAEHQAEIDARRRK